MHTSYLLDCDTCVPSSEESLDVQCVFDCCEQAANVTLSMQTEQCMEGRPSCPPHPRIPLPQADMTHP